MKAKNIGEEEAYALLRRTAMNKNRKITEIAQSLVTAADLLRGRPVTHRIVAGFMPLLDSAILVVAATRGFASRSRGSRPPPPARDLLGQHPRPRGGGTRAGCAYARAHAGRLQPGPDPARCADRGPHGPGPRRQQRHRLRRRLESEPKGAQADLAPAPPARPCAASRRGARRRAPRPSASPSSTPIPATTTSFATGSPPAAWFPAGTWRSWILPPSLMPDAWPPARSTASARASPGQRRRDAGARPHRHRQGRDLAAQARRRSSVPTPPGPRPPRGARRPAARPAPRLAPGAPTPRNHEELARLLADPAHVGCARPVASSPLSGRLQVGPGTERRVPDFFVPQASYDLPLEEPRPLVLQPDGALVAGGALGPRTPLRRATLHLGLPPRLAAPGPWPSPPPTPRSRARSNTHPGRIGWGRASCSGRTASSTGSDSTPIRSTPTSPRSASSQLPKGRDRPARSLGSHEAAGSAARPAAMPKMQAVYVHGKLRFSAIFLA